MKGWIIPAIGIISAVVCAGPLFAQSHGNAPQTEPFKVDATLADTGRRLFSARGCVGCHTVGKGDLSAPDLSGLLERRSVGWIKKWLRNPTLMLESDETAKELARRYGNMRMPNLRLTDNEITALLHHIAAETAAARQTPAATQ